MVLETRRNHLQEDRHRRGSTNGHEGGGKCEVGEMMQYLPLRAQPLARRTEENLSGRRVCAQNFVS